MKRELEYKLDGKQILYFNGLKWLVKETCPTIKKAKELLKELNGKTNG